GISAPFQDHSRSIVSEPDRVPRYDLFIIADSYFLKKFVDMAFIVRFAAASAQSVDHMVCAALLQCFKKSRIDTIKCRHHIKNPLRLPSFIESNGVPTTIGIYCGLLNLVANSFRPFYLVGAVRRPFVPTDIA